MGEFKLGYGNISNTSSTNYKDGLETAVSEDGNNTVVKAMGSEYYRYWVTAGGSGNNRLLHQPEVPEDISDISLFNHNLSGDDSTRIAADEFWVERPARYPTADFNSAALTIAENFTVELLIDPAVMLAFTGADQIAAYHGGATAAFRDWDVRRSASTGAWTVEISRYSAAGTPSYSFSRTNNDPFLLTFDSDGNVYINAAAAGTLTPNAYAAGSADVVFSATGGTGLGRFRYWSRVLAAAEVAYFAERPEIGKNEYLELAYDCSTADVAAGHLIDTSGNSLNSDTFGTGSWSTIKNPLVDFDSGLIRAARNKKRVCGVFDDPADTAEYLAAIDAAAEWSLSAWIQLGNPATFSTGIHTVLWVGDGTSDTGAGSGDVVWLRYNASAQLVLLVYNDSTLTNVAGNDFIADGTKFHISIQSSAVTGLCSVWIDGVVAYEGVSVSSSQLGVTNAKLLFGGGAVSAVSFDSAKFNISDFCFMNGLNGQWLADNRYVMKNLDMHPQMQYVKTFTSIDKTFTLGKMEIDESPVPHGGFTRPTIATKMTAAVPDCAEILVEAFRDGDTAFALGHLGAWQTWEPTIWYSRMGKQFSAPAIRSLDTGFPAGSYGIGNATHSLELPELTAAEYYELESIINYAARNREFIFAHFESGDLDLELTRPMHSVVGVPLSCQMGRSGSTNRPFSATVRINAIYT